MAQRRHIPSLRRRRLVVAQLAAVMALMCAASTTAQPQSLPLPQPTTTTASTPAAVPSLPAPCPPARATLAPCLSFLSFLTSNSSSPPAECCAQIRAMFQSQAPCLCAAMASGPASQLGLGSALGQLLPSSCDLPANACSGATSGAPAGPTTTTPAAPGSGTAAAAAPGTGPVDEDPTAPAGGGGMKSVPGFVDSGAAAAAGYGGVSAAAALISLLAAYLL